MKVKQTPDDFRVEEVSRLEPGTEGRFTLYRLEKAGIGTPEAMRLVAREWRLAPGDVAFAGLKDRHGRTGQMVTIRRGRARNFLGRGFKLNYLGRGPRPAARGTIQENRFRIVLRDLASAEAERLATRARAAAEAGFPDYYDDQRFGSLRGTSGRFVARALLEGDYESALKLAVASPARADRSHVKQRRKELRDRWGDWRSLVARLKRSPERRICERLAAGGTFEEAYQLIDVSLRALHLSAFQARLFNECLRGAIGDRGPSHPGAAGPYRFYRGSPPADLQERRIPLASARAEADPLLDAVLARESLTRDSLVRLDFREGSRAAVAFPTDLDVGEATGDELNPGRAAVALSFSLSPGCYATMLIKRCTHDF